MTSKSIETAWGEEFLLTHPVWDVTHERAKFVGSARFLLTHPVWDVTREQQISPPEDSISTHTSRVGCDLILLYTIMTIMSFLLTHPVWDVTAIYSIFQSHYSHILQDGPIIHLELY